MLIRMKVLFLSLIFLGGATSLLASTGILDQRTSGMLLHFTALPSPHGVGDLGEEAREFVDFLVETETKVWQVLPISQTDRHGGPYSALGAFSGNPMLIDMDELVEAGLLSKGSLGLLSSLPQDKVDYPKVWEVKTKLLYEAFEKAKEKPKLLAELEQFSKEECSWLDDFALFMALRKHFGYVSWADWPEEVAKGEKKQLIELSEKLKEQVSFVKFSQFWFYKQWRAIKSYANARGVSVLGDVPIYVSYNSVDVWKHQDLFSLSESLSMAYTAGVPPDDFSADGQNWMMPLYNWPVHIGSGFDWWTKRFGKAVEMFDATRVDHFRGFEAYFAIPAGRHAREGEWRKAPGYELFHALENNLGALPFIAEDLGFITDEVHELRKAFGFPGMRILQFGMFGGDGNPHDPTNIDEGSTAYTGTHDNNTVIGWYHTLNQDGKDYVRWKLGAADSDGDVAYKMIELVWSTPAKLAVTTLQDLLQLDARSRFNIPGTPDGNWSWRFAKGQLNKKHYTFLKSLNMRHIR